MLVNSSDGEKGLVYDLSTIVGHPLVMIAAPFGYNLYPIYHMMDQTHGWAALGRANDAYLYKWQAGFWHPVVKIKNQDGYGVRLFAETTERCWFVVDDSLAARQCLMRIDDQSVRQVFTPQTAGIRGLFFDRNGGWAGGEWGQLMRFHSGRWRLFPSPTPFHIENFFQSGGKLFASTDIPGRDEFTLLNFQGGDWREYARIHLPVNSRFVILPRGRQYALRADTLLCHTDQSWQSVERDKIPADTVLIDAELNFDRIMWAYSGAQVLCGRLFALKEHSDDPPIELVEHLATRVLDDRQHEAEFALFSPDSLRSLLFVRAHQLKPPKFNFSPRIIHHSSSEYSATVIDIDSDGGEEIYAVVGGGANRLYHLSFLGDGIESVTDEAERYDLHGKMFTVKKKVNYDHLAAFADVNNDGLADLLINSLYGPNAFYRQVSSGRFVEQTRAAGLLKDFGRSSALLRCDVNNDGFIDLFIGNTDSSSHLYLNNGAGIFRDVTAAAMGGIRVSTAAFADVDGDGDSDLFLMFSRGTNRLLINQGADSRTGVPRFRWEQNRIDAETDTLASSGGCCFADFDNDGDVDLLALKNLSPCILLQNDGRGYFSDVTASSGLADSTFAISAAPFDADHDGDLDLWISKRGRSALYENLGGLTFRRHDFFQRSLDNGGHVVLADLDMDGDLDFYTNDQNDYSRIMLNPLNDGNSALLQLEGSVSNRDAIGAKVFIYPAGHCGNPDSLKGVRVVTGDQHTRRVHIGLPNGHACDLLIRFPSGIEKRLLNVGKTRLMHVNETDGFDRRLTLARKASIAWFYYPPFRHQLMYLTLIVLMFVGALLWLHQSRFWLPNASWFYGWLPAMVFSALFMSLYQQSLVIRLALPLFFSLAVALFGHFFVGRTVARTQFVPQVTEELFLLLSAFFHGQWGASRFNRLELYLINMSRQAIADEEFRVNLNRTVDDFFAVLAPAVNKILELATSLKTLNDLHRTTSSSFTLLLRDLNAFKVSVSLQKPLEELSIASLRERLALIRGNLLTMRRQIDGEFKASVQSVIEEMRRQFPQRFFQIDCDLPPSVTARIRPAELSQILENLLHNAVRAVNGRRNKRITLKCRSSLDRVFITVQDNGIGMSEEIQTKLFCNHFTTKNHGGFGLHHAHQLLQKYGGGIHLRQSAVNQGSTFEVELRREDHE